MGYNPVKQKFELRPRVGYMPQQLALYDDLSAHENVSFFGTARQIPNLKKRVTEVLELLELGDRENDPVHEFSGGMKQRVSLACALVHQPKLLLLDEPTTGVDPKLRESLWSHFHNLTTEGVTILVSTHQMDEAFHCNRVAVMRGGMALAVDTPRGLMARGHARVKVWRNGSTETHDMENYRDELPQLLGIREQIDKIEIEEDTLEDVVLDLIAEKELSHA
jgi:ABC-2 type transport system ATP-binding protein